MSKLNTQSEIIKPRKDSEADIFIPRMMPDWQDYFDFEET